MQGMLTTSKSKMFFTYVKDNKFRLCSITKFKMVVTKYKLPKPTIKLTAPIHLGKKKIDKNSKMAPIA